VAGAPDPRAVAIRFWTSVHEGWFRATDGRVLNRTLGMPVVMLTTTGHRTGRPRTVMLTSPVQQGESVVLVASNAGGTAHPAWFVNVRHNPRVEVTMDGRRRAMDARVLSDEERERVWPLVVAAYEGYATYQDRTARSIPLVVLDPAG